MTTNYSFKPIMTSNIRLLMGKYIEMANILARNGFDYDELNGCAEKIIAEIDRMAEEGGNEE